MLRMGRLALPQPGQATRAWFKVTAMEEELQCSIIDCLLRGRLEMATKLLPHSDMLREFSVSATSILLIPPSAYAQPVPYERSANLTQIYTNVNSTNWTLLYRCQNCRLNDDPRKPAPARNVTQTVVGLFEFGWAQSTVAVDEVTNPDSNFLQHDNGQGEFVIEVASATRASYSQWTTIIQSGTVSTGTVVTTS
jgi:hypothetical protein